MEKEKGKLSTTHLSMREIGYELVLSIRYHSANF